MSELALPLVGLVGGALAGVSPCVLPVLPVVLLGSAVTGADGAPTSRARPVAIVAGLVLSFALFTLFGTVVLSLLHLPAGLIRWVGIGALLLLGVAMLVTPHRRPSRTEPLMTILEAIQPVTGGRTITDPATGEAVGRVAEPGVADLDAAVAAARAAQPGWTARGDAGRAALLSAAADAVEAHAEELAVLLSREQGKPLNGPNARFELEACATWLRATLAVPLDPEVAVDDGETYAEIHHRPLGVVGAIGPWNWPMMISIWQLAHALRMGNTVVIKPSEYTPLSVLALAHVLNTVLPADVLVAVPGGRGVGEALSAHPGIDKLMFTGSTVTGKAIIRASADSVKRVTVELGGNDAGIVLDDADPAAIAEGLFWGAFINTGQTCAALKRLYVPDSLYDAVCDELTKVAAAMPMGVGLDEQNVLGPLQNRQQYDIVAGLVDEARAGGGRVLIGGDPADGPGNFYPTTLVADLPNDNPARRAGAVRARTADRPVLEPRRGDRLGERPRRRSRCLGVDPVACARPRRGPAARRGHRVDQRARRHRPAGALRRRQAVGLRRRVRARGPARMRPARRDQGRCGLVRPIGLNARARSAGNTLATAGLRARHYTVSPSIAHSFRPAVLSRKRSGLRETISTSPASTRV